MTTRPLSLPKIQKATFACAIAWIMICTLGLHYVVNFSWTVSFVDSFVNNLLLVAACIGISNMLGYYQPKNERLFYVLMLAVALTLLVVALGKYILVYLYADFKNYIDFYSFSLAFRALLAFMCLAWCCLANILWYKLEEQSEAQNRLSVAQHLAKEAELNKLRHQLQPHFLFNSLNSVFALTMVNPKEAGVMIIKLASFLRGTLKRDDEIWVKIAEEMEYIQLYLDIEKVRFSHRLNVDLHVEPDTMELYLPGTFLQPLVENAIKFGLYNTSEAITIKIDISLEEGLLKIVVKNPYDPKMTAAEGTGFGLTSVKRRLYLLFANPDLLQAETTDDHIYITTLKIPQRND